MKKIIFIIMFLFVIVSISSIKVKANSNLMWVGDPEDKPLGIEYFNQGGQHLERVEWSKTDSLHGYYMTVMYDIHQKTYLIRYIEYLIIIITPSMILDISSVNVKITKGGIYECASNVVSIKHTLDSQPTSQMGIKDINIGFNIATTETDFFVQEVISSNLSFPNNINSSAIDCLSLLIPYNTYVNYAMVAIDLAHVATYQRTISQEINTVEIYGGTLQDECESDGNNIENVMPNNQMDEYDGNTIKGLGISMNNNARLAKLSDFVYIQGMVNNINNSLFRSSQRLMRYNVSFTIYHETENNTKNIAVYLDKDYIREECHPSDTNLNNHTVYYSSYNVIQHRVKCSHCSFVKFEYHQWIHKNAETYCNKCNFVSAVQPWGNDEITG